MVHSVGMFTGWFLTRREGEVRLTGWVEDGVELILTLRDPPRPGPAHPREHGDSAAPKSLDPKQ